MLTPEKEEGKKNKKKGISELNCVN